MHYKKTIADIIGIPKVLYLVPRARKRLYGVIENEMELKRHSKPQP
jgi:hypothetical protein